VFTEEVRLPVNTRTVSCSFGVGDGDGEGCWPMANEKHAAMIRITNGYLSNNTGLNESRV
ncbi:MAG TPA: hypothetical protein VHH35_20505, partial [Pyrinomonadaceae bacterium]|nr:hypothetical protein [Pyrinomonadaceae bacterium]